MPLAALQNHATESVAAQTGNAVGGLLNTVLGKLAELVIAPFGLAAVTLAGVTVLVLVVDLIFAMTLDLLPPRGQ